MGWVSAGDYEVALDGGAVVCRNAAGRLLKSVPPKIADDPAVVGLKQLVESLERHERQCDLVHSAAADRTHDVFGRLDPTDPARFARAWLAAAHYTEELDRALCAAAWSG
ncbi:hypothetical protein ACIRU5_23580 [Streptomyces misionensis]|uniref:hypothetical protein n=1 Tax=Streptomyces misionensis TaxID=67331 RepID=UPI003824FDCE